MTLWMLALSAFVELSVIAVRSGTLSELLVWGILFGVWFFLISILNAGYPNITWFLAAHNLSLSLSLVLYAQLRLVLPIDAATLLTLLFAIVYMGHYFGFFYLFLSPARQEAQSERVSRFLDRASDFNISLIDLMRVHARYFWPHR